MPDAPPAALAGVAEIIARHTSAPAPPVGAEQWRPIGDAATPPPAPAEAQEAAAMTLDLEALKRVAEALARVPFPGCSERVITEWQDAREQFARMVTGPTVLALIARLEAAEKVDPTTLDDYWRDAVGGAYKPVKLGKHVASHPQTVKRILAEVAGTEAADVIAALVWKTCMGWRWSSAMEEQARAAGFREGIEAAAKDLHAHVVLGDGHGTACAIERHLRALTAAPEPQA